MYWSSYLKDTQTSENTFLETSSKIQAIICELGKKYLTNITYTEVKQKLKLLSFGFIFKSLQD